MNKNEYQMDRKFDVVLGKQFRTVRKRVGVSKEVISGVVNVSPQQFQKYESGQNRFPLEKLLTALRYLGFPAVTFLKALEEIITEGIAVNTTVNIPREDYAALVELATNVQQLAENVRRIVNVHKET